MVVLDLTPIVCLTRAQFYELCRANPECKLERSATGELIVMAPTGGETGYYNSSLIGQVYVWNQANKLGIVFDSSTGFALPNSADRSPDVAWLKLERWEKLTIDERRGFLPLCPDFVIELLSPTDSWPAIQNKMTEYQQNGCRLGWSIDPKGKRVAIYRLSHPSEIVYSPLSLSGEDVLPGFILDLSFLW